MAGENPTATSSPRSAASTQRSGHQHRSVIALWLGHESVETTQMYLDADLSTKEAALAKTRPTRSTADRYKPGDRLLAFLTNL